MINISLNNKLYKLSKKEYLDNLYNIKKININLSKKN